MHLLATRPGGYAAGDGVVDLAQTPADIVILSAADTDLHLLADACDHMPDDYPSLRLANLLALRSNASVDLYCDQVLDRAQLVVVAMMGGTGYWPYGVEQLVERARDKKLTLVLVPGDDTPDPELDRLSSVPPEDCRRVWRYLREGGPANAAALLAFLAHRYFERGADPAEARPLPRVALYHPSMPIAQLSDWQLDQVGPRSALRGDLNPRSALRGDRKNWRVGAPVVALLFYRAHVQAGNLAAFDHMIEALMGAGLNPLPISLTSLKDPLCRAGVDELLERANAALVLNTTGFSIGNLEHPDASACSVRAHGPTFDAAFGRDRPVLQVIMSGGNVDDWREQLSGLSPRDLAMSVVLPEIDGRIITRAISWKGLARRCERAQIDVAQYHVDPERAQFVTELAARWIALAQTPAAERRVALVLANYPARDGRLGNGVGLDTPASTVEILRALAGAGYGVAGIPEDGKALMQRLTEHVTNDLEWNDQRACEQSLSLEDYARHFETLPAALRAQVTERWGAPGADPRVRAGRVMLSGFQLGNVFIGIQPARGYEIDILGSYHDPDLVPPHGYLAFYFWLRHAYRAHALVHIGKHGTLEWLPGKSVALSDHCWPDAVLGPMPHLYPFIVNDPGEGSQAKRRAQAVIIDHLVPPLTRAETYGALRELERLVDEYYQALVLDPVRAASLRKDILECARAANLDRELSQAANQSAALDEDRFLQRIDAYLCELKESQIRDGLHIFGRSPVGAQRLDTLVALARAPVRRGQAADQGLLQALSTALLGSRQGLGFDPLDCDFAAPWSGPRPAELAQLSNAMWRSAGDTRERLELLARAILAGELPPPAACSAVVERVQREAAEALDVCGEHEIAGLLAGLDGRFVPPGPSGAPTRGRLDVLPTGRNFYSVDVRAVPTPAAYRLAERAAARLVQRYVQDHGEYPECIALSVWGTATMRTGGDDIAQALALLGVRPVWSAGSGRVVDTEILPLSVLGRPRVDVVLRISGFFRDAFPELIRLVDSALQTVAALDESAGENPIKARVQRDEAMLREQGLSEPEAYKRARWRIFGSKPGAYGAGLSHLIDQRAWRERRDLAAAYLDWSGYAYSAADSGVRAREHLEATLTAVDAIVQNQDNREHDVLDSGDYYEFQGGLSAAVEHARGQPATLYHGDNANPEAPRIRDLREELARVIRSRVVNPKWIAAARRHGYKGAAEMAATVDYLFGYDAATGIVADHQYELVSDAYLLDAHNRAFLEEHNPSALRDMTERLLEAIQREMWRNPGARRDALEMLLLDSEEGGS